MRWRVAYDLTADAASVQRMAKVTRSGGGIGSEPAVIGSDEWWSLVGTDRLPVHTQEGEVERSFWSGHNDFAEFTLVTPDGTRRDWPRFGDHTLYAEGLRVRVQWVEQRWAEPNRFADVVGERARVCVRVEVEDSERRSEGHPSHT